jgi:ABC-type multidrug transport system ATPase subunit
MGRNGAGKTTLMRIAAGWLRPDYGVVHFSGIVTQRPRLARLAEAGLFFVPQEQLLSEKFTVRRHIEAVAAVFGANHVDAAIEETRIEALLDQPVWELSGGERMRASLALGIVRRPVCLIIDEPLIRTSPQDQETLSTAMRSLAEKGVAIVTSGHDARPLLALSDAIIWCVAGTTHHIGTPQEALRHTQFMREYLGPGYSDLREDSTSS